MLSGHGDSCGPVQFCQSKLQFVYYHFRVSLSMFSFLVNLIKLASHGRHSSLLSSMVETNTRIYTYKQYIYIYMCALIYNKFFFLGRKRYFNVMILLFMFKNFCIFHNWKGTFKLRDLDGGNCNLTCDREKWWACKWRLECPNSSYALMMMFIDRTRESPAKISPLSSSSSWQQFCIARIV